MPKALHNNPARMSVCFCLFSSGNKEPSISWVFFFSLHVHVHVSEDRAREEVNSSSGVCGSKGPQWGGWVDKFEHA